MGRMVVVGNDVWWEEICDVAAFETSLPDLASRGPPVPNE